MSFASVCVTTQGAPARTPPKHRLRALVQDFTVELSPMLAPDSTTQPAYEYTEDLTTQTTSSELLGALGPETQNSGYKNWQTTFSTIFNPFPGHYHPDYLSQNFQPPPDALPFSTVETMETEVVTNTEQRMTKRRRMSTHSASEPPCSAVSFSSYADSYSGHSSTTSHSRHSSMDFPFFPPLYSIFCGSGNTFWHPPTLPADRSPQLVHPPMLPAEDAPMGFFHPPMLPQDEDNFFATYLHPPMLLPAEDSNMQHQHQQQVSKLIIRLRRTIFTSLPCKPFNGHHNFCAPLASQISTGLSHRLCHLSAFSSAAPSVDLTQKPSID
jgi:GATA-binding protein, other eukaryote